MRISDWSSDVGSSDLAGAQKAAVCAACHGVDGNPADPMYPRMAGQSERYIARQLALFKRGERNTGLAALMVPFATMLSPQDMRDVGAYYATQVAGAGIADDTDRHSTRLNSRHYIATCMTALT